MTDAWEMHPETGLNPGPVWRDRGTIIANLTARNQGLEERVAELELAALNLRDNTQGAHEREQALRERLTALADEWQAACDSGSNGRHGYHCSEYGDYYAADLRDALAASPAVDATPEPTPAAEPQAEGGACDRPVYVLGHYTGQCILTADHLPECRIAQAKQVRPAPVADPSGDTP